MILLVLVNSFYSRSIHPKDLFLFPQIIKKNIHLYMYMTIYILFKGIESQTQIF